MKTFSILCILMVSLSACRQKGTSTTTAPDRFDSIAKDIAYMANTMSKDSVEYFDFADLSAAGDALPYEYYAWQPERPLYALTACRYRKTDSLHIYEICRHPQILYYAYDHDADTDTAQYHDGIMIAGQYFNIDSLEYILSDHHSRGPDYSELVYVTGCYVLHMKQTYVAFEYSNMRGSSSCFAKVILFFELRDHKVYRTTELLQDCMGQISSFGDFNKDGNIDFAEVVDRDDERPEVICRTLTDTGFAQIPGLYIPLEPRDAWYRKPTDFSHWF